MGKTRLLFANNAAQNGVVPVAARGTFLVSAPGGSGGGSYTAATLPSPPSPDGTTVYVSDGDGGAPCLAVSDGMIWHRVPLGAAVSSYFPTTIPGCILGLQGGSGTTWIDRVGSHSATLNNGAVFSGANVAFSAPNSYARITNGYSDLISGRSESTVVARLNPTSISTALIWSRVSGSNDYGAIVSTGKLSMSTAGTSVLNALDNSIATGSFQSIALVLGGGAGTIYNNAVSKGSSTLPNYSTATEDMNIGNYWDTDLTNYPFQGAMSSFLIYNRALTVSELTTLMNAGY